MSINYGTVYLSGAGGPRARSGGSLSCIGDCIATLHRRFFLSPNSNSEVQVRLRTFASIPAQAQVERICGHHDESDFASAVPQCHKAGTGRCASALQHVHTKRLLLHRLRRLARIVTSLHQNWHRVFGYRVVSTDAGARVLGNHGDLRARCRDNCSASSSATSNCLYLDRCRILPVRINFRHALCTLGRRYSTHAFSCCRLWCSEVHVCLGSLRSAAVPGLNSG